MDWERDQKVIVELYYKCIEENNKELYLRLDNNHQKAKNIYSLVRFITDRISTVWLLTLENKLWDADIIDRSVLEALIKLMFITHAPNKEEQQVRFKEYWGDLSEINDLKHSDQSKKMLNLFTDELSKLAHKSLIISEREENQLREKWPKKDRNRLEQKWSFSEMLISLSKNYKGQPFEMLFGLAFEYRMSSHVAHGDEIGIGIIEERKSRSEKDRTTVHLGHYLKLMSNCLAYSSLVSTTAMDYLEMDKDFFIKNASKIDSIENLIDEYKREVFNDPDYNKYK